MRFSSIEINDFRNISSASASSDSEDIVLVGTNGQGKTSFLEAVYMLCYGSSFRTPHLREAVMHGKPGFSISAEFEDEGFRERITTSYIEGKRRIAIDGKEVKDRKDLIYRFPCIAFIHEDIGFIKGEPEERRRFFDQMMSLHSPFFFDDSRSYRAVLMQRNAAVKTGDRSLISLYNGRLASYGLEIMKARAEAVYEFNRIFPSLFRKISGLDMDLEIRYQPSWAGMEDAEDISGYLEENTERDIILKTTTSGVHRDRFTVMSPMGPFQSIGSTGQIRLCSIIFRIAEAEYFRKMTGRKPILLIDDVLLELDDVKRARVLSSLEGYSQAFYTFLPRESYFGDNDHALYYDVEGGNIRKRAEDEGSGADK